MQSLYILLPVALFFCVIAITAWFWAVSSGQYDDLDKDASSILFDDDSNDANPAGIPKQVRNDSSETTGIPKQVRNDTEKT